MATYRNWKNYRLTYHTYQGNLEYVQFHEKMMEKVECIANEAALLGDQWLKNELVAFNQSLEIALQFHNISRGSVVSALNEHQLRFYFHCQKDLDGVYLEIWKQVARKKMNFLDALRQLYEMNIFPFRRPDIKAALDSYPGFCLIKYNYDTFIDGINETFSDDEAHPLVIEAVEKMFEGWKNYLDYARKKLEIGERIGLPKISSRDVTAQDGEDHGEKNTAIAS
ncbi:hypothetical protein ZWY2020_018394 [Hordeum vulgare]|nr:hypothetical protein ZWY2020_018394 [Hordeum vulgare]